MAFKGGIKDCGSRSFSGDKAELGYFFFTQGKKPDIIRPVLCNLVHFGGSVGPTIAHNRLLGPY
jgi:hypothetical protein